jgi:serine/threonine protein kinase
MDLTGTRIGHIRIESLIAKGGFGEVYRGFDEVLQRAVAVKVMHGDRQMSAESRSRFLREARALSKLDQRSRTGRVRRKFTTISRSFAGTAAIWIKRSSSITHLAQSKDKSGTGSAKRIHGTTSRRLQKYCWRRFKYEKGNLDAAFRTMTEAKTSAGSSDWSEEREALLAAYRKAATANEKIPLPEYQP